MGRYFRRKLLIYLLTFFAAVSINWMIPRLMPGDPIRALIGRAALRAEAADKVAEYFSRIYGLDQPAWRQYVNFWTSLFKGDLGISIYLSPKPVTQVIRDSIPFDLGLLIPAILCSWIVGNKFGAFAARRKRLDGIVLPIWYVFTATPYMWLAILLAYVFGVLLGIFPIAGAYSFAISPSLSISFILNYLKHWFLPFLSLFIVQLGGWAIGMRNMIIYELEADYSRYMESLGAPRKLIRRYAFRNAMLPQITGLALQLGVIVAGAVGTQVVFSYPGIGYLLLQAVMYKDYFLIQGCFLFIVIGVLIANFVIDVIYVIVDPRVRHGMGGETA